MKRTKTWWRKLNRADRSYLVWYERKQNESTLMGGYLPDDCCDCSVCGGPAWLSSPCRYCRDIYRRLLAKAAGKREVGPDASEYA